MRIIMSALISLTIFLASCTPSMVQSTAVLDSPPPTEKDTSNPPNTSTLKPSAIISPALSETPSPTSTPWAFNSQVSPNGEFVANAYFENMLPSGIETIEIRNKEGELIWQIPFQGEMSTSDPRRLLDIFQWSNDSSQLYFYYVLSPDGGDRAFWWTGFDLQRIDMKTGEIEYVLPGTGFMSFAISPDGTRIAYTRQEDQPYVIYIRSLSTGSEKTAYVIGGSNGYAGVGDIYWSPTGEGIAFQTETNDYMVQTVYLNLLTMRQRVIKKYKVFDIDFQGWTADGKLEFRVYGPSSSQIVHVDVSNDEVVIIGTPTRAP